MARKILIVEDDPDISSLIVMHVQEAGYDTEHVASGSEALTAYKNSPPDLMILDLMLPGVDGLDVCRAIRKQDERLPILMLTAKSTELDRVLGLELGADDYLTKPFSVVELMARVKAMLRRMDAMSTPEEASSATAMLEFKGLKIDVSRHSVETQHGSIDLTAREFELLVHLASSPGQVFSRSQLLDKVWGYNHGGYEHTVNTHINRLRIKLETDATQPEYIQTVWGVGYKFSDSKAV